jgi:hypothetical protein
MPGATSQLHFAIGSEGHHVWLPQSTRASARDASAARIRKARRLKILTNIEEHVDKN